MDKQKQSTTQESQPKYVKPKVQDLGKLSTLIKGAGGSAADLFVPSAGDVQH